MYRTEALFRQSGVTARRCFSAILALALLASLACGSSPHESGVEETQATPDPNLPPLPVEIAASGVRVFIVGVDGATRRVLDPLIAEGELPNVARLLESGTVSVLRSQKPMFSPALWTTMATGHRRSEHGIEHFTHRDEETGEKVLANSGLRERLNVWDILGAGGRSVGVAGWWATWPAEPVNGWLVSDRLTRSRWSEWADGAKTKAVSYPEALAEEALEYACDPADPPLERIREIVPLTSEEEAELLAAETPLRGHGLSVLKFSLCTQLTYERLTRAQLEKEQPDFGSVFLIANDAISHTFWHYHEPERFDGVAAEETARLAEAVNNMYRHNDRYLGELLDLLGEQTVVMIVSDHGFQAGKKLPTKTAGRGRVDKAFSEEFLEGQEHDDQVTVGQSGIHHPDGLLVVGGGPVVEGARFTETPTIEDLVPTVLALMGFPVADDMPGRVLTEMISPEFLDRFPVRSIPSYEEILDRDLLRNMVEATPAEEDDLKMLQALGYVE